MGDLFGIHIDWNTWFPVLAVVLVIYALAEIRRILLEIHSTLLDIEAHVDAESSFDESPPLTRSAEAS